MTCSPSSIKLMFRWLPAFCSHRRVGKPPAQLEPVDSESESVGSVAVVSEPPADLTTDPRAEFVVQEHEHTTCGLVGAQPEEFGLTSEKDDIRWYAVWDVPYVRREVISGVHWGRGTTAYSGILNLAKREFKRIKWQRCPNQAAAQERFRLEAHRFALPQSTSQRVFGWVPGDGSEGGP